jgi:hypothetical protein
VPGDLAAAVGLDYRGAILRQLFALCALTSGVNGVVLEQDYGVFPSSMRDFRVDGVLKFEPRFV